MNAAGEEPSQFHSLFDPDHADFLHPDNMVSAIDEYCRRTGQRVPLGPAAYARGILESLAFKYRYVLESLENLTGIHFEEIRIMGGGSKNHLLNQFTALGNIAMQMLATGAVGSLAEARQVIDRSFPVEAFYPSNADRWDPPYQRFKDYL
jgi:rhamnulokinase